MKNILISILIFFMSFQLFAQSFEETQQWITFNVSSKKWDISNQVSYDSSTGMLKLINVSTYPSLSATVSEINPKHVASVSLSDTNRSDGLKSIRLNFRSGGTKVKSYFVDDKFRINRSLPVEERNMYGYEIFAECGLEKIKSIKKAYINLFNKLGVPVKDGDYF